MKWLTNRVYNRFDSIWIYFMGLFAAHEQWAAMLIILLVGVFASALLELAFDR